MNKKVLAITIAVIAFSLSFTSLGYADVNKHSFFDFKSFFQMVGKAIWKIPSFLNKLVMRNSCEIAGGKCRVMCLEDEYENVSLSPTCSRVLGARKPLKCCFKKQPEGYLQVATTKKQYFVGEQVNLTDPPSIESRKNKRKTRLVSDLLKEEFPASEKIIIFNKTQNAYPEEFSFFYRENELELWRGTEKVRYKGWIVELKDPPLSEFIKYKASGKPSFFQPGTGHAIRKIKTSREYLKYLKKKQSQVKQKIARKLGISQAKLEPKIKESFSIVFNGFSLNITDEEAIKISKLDEVKRIYPDYEVKALLNESVDIINAYQVWLIQDPNNPEWNLTGKNITIAIIDTGIDYTHPDLGACTTEQFLSGTCSKVIGGWDFVNNDPDPMDDNGHGTHCASIAAGTGAASNGKFKGVAPDAKLLAYKVLSRYGGGCESDVIAGIERALDPNQDGNFSDHADVISMSLGMPYFFFGDCYQVASSKAVDNAVDLGVIVVVAAGNEGFLGEKTISAPGCARKVITVGASCKPSQIGNLDYCGSQIASFSSRGPTKDYRVKPDVVAPGVLICAANTSHGWLGSYYGASCGNPAYMAISGTSMATPHVAGAAALLKQAHPDWSPEKIKAALMQSSSQLTGKVLEEGNGQIDVLNVLNISFLILPASFNLVIPPDTEIWNSTFFVINTKEKETYFNLSATFNNSFFPSITLFPNEFYLAPKQNRSVSFLVNTSIFSRGYYPGFLRIKNSSTSSVDIPVSFIMFYNLLNVLIRPKSCNHNLYTFMMAWFDKDRVYQESFYSGFITDPYNLQKTIYVSNNTIELITILTEHMPESSSRPNTITYFITGVNFEDSYNKTLVLDANKAKKINSNIYQIVEREGMAPRRATSAFIFYNCTRGNSTCFTVSNGFLKKLDIYVNATNNLFNEYLITCEAQAEQEEGPLCEKVLILPFSVFYPFEKNYTFISDRELKTITIYLNDSFYPEETRKAFGITSYTPKQSFILVSSPETSKRKFLITFRKNLSCESCNYLILTVSWGEGILVKSYNGNSFGCVVDIEELNNSYPFLPIYLLNFSINVSSAKCLRIPDLVGKIGDKKWFTSVYLSEPKGKLKITREADGATFETNVTAGSFWESVREFMNRKGIYTIEWDPGILKNKACITAVINLTDTLLPSFTFLSYTKGKMIDGSCIPKSLIENTGNVPIKGYLVMKVKKRKEL